ncbi:hypothetical protein EW145_g4660 [Phellinidium pouzarii]|uniref:UBZ4-type domain-containing protein n=1 Tax=Phellinidium pouzarii TaxID=167371 RepID=A0A4S4L421_9AGAM|nr:hypothetical protein EW145_g4660 [Phellinidium pouzarii]
MRALAEPEGTPSRAGSSSLSPSPLPEEQPKANRSKRAVTRVCPVCSEKIPLRLLGIHADFEMNRVEDILKGVGPSVMFVHSESEPITSRRGAALKARRCINPRGGPEMDTIAQVEKTLKLLRRNRKSRIAKLKEIIAQDEDEQPGLAITGNEITCPVCLTKVRGDEDLIETHVNTCLANSARLQAEAEEQERRKREVQMRGDTWSEIEVDGDVRLHLNHINGLRGMGIHIRDHTQLDVEEEVDVDGDDEFGMAQFTERDVMDPSFIRQEVDSNGDVEDEDDEGRALRSLVAEGKVITRRQISPDLNGVRAEIEKVMGVGEAERMDQAVVAAKNSGNTAKLVAALNDKIKQLVCLAL